MFPSIYGFIHCSGCSLANGAWTTTSRKEAIAHLKEHEASGETVPSHAYEELEKEIKEYGDEYSNDDYK